MIVAGCLLFSFDGIIVVHDRLSQFQNGAAVLLGILLQIDHVLLEPLNETRVVLLAHIDATGGVRCRVLRLECLGHDRHSLLLHELLDLGKLRSHSTFGIIPYSNRIILETRRHSVFIRKLKHLRLLLTEAIDRLSL